MTTSTKSEDVEALAGKVGRGVILLTAADDQTCGHGAEATVSDTLRALVAERDALTAEWGDERDEFTDEIEAAHPFREPKDFRRYNLAQAMVSARHSKLELIKLVAWLLTFRAEQARAALGTNQDEESK